MVTSFSSLLISAFLVTVTHQSRAIFRESDSIQGLADLSPVKVESATEFLWDTSAPTEGTERTTFTHDPTTNTDGGSTPTTGAATEGTTTTDSDTTTATSTTEEPIDYANATLDEKGDKEEGWIVPRDTIPKWFNYYPSTESFIEDRNSSSSSCASMVPLDELQRLEEVDGMWIACQDPNLPRECNVSLTDPCHPSIAYKGKAYMTEFKSIKLTFTLFELGTLRLKIGGGSAYGMCIDYTLRADPFSPCEIREIDEEMAESGWHQAVFAYPPKEDVSFREFEVHLISRFAHDVVLLDKIEATSVLLEDEGSTTTETTSSSTSTASTTAATTTISSTSTSTSTPSPSPTLSTPSTTSSITSTEAEESTATSMETETTFTTEKEDDPPPKTTPKPETSTKPSSASNSYSSSSIFLSLIPIMLPFTINFKLLK